MQFGVLAQVLFGVLGDILARLVGRVLGGMQFGVLVQVLLWGAIRVVTMHLQHWRPGARGGGVRVLSRVLLDAGDGIGAFLARLTAGLGGMCRCRFRYVGSMLVYLVIIVSRKPLLLYYSIIVRS